MSAAARTPVKSPAKTGPQRPNAWTGSRASPTFSAAAATRPGFPPLGNTNDKEKIVSGLAGVAGTAVTLTTKPNTVYHGTVVAANPTTITLADVTQPNNPSAPVTPSLSLNPSDVISWAPATQQQQKDSFQTDTDISAKKNKGSERELQAWQPDLSTEEADGFDLNSSKIQWDQFAANESMFGVKTSWDEDQYTTKIDRSAPGFKEKERKAQIQANEIMGQQSSNPHVQEERIQNFTGDSGDKEEEKYSGVARSANAYVPPGARKPGSAAPTPPPTKPTGTANNSDSVVPTVAVTADGKDPKTPSDPTKAFKIFVDSEKERLKAKKTEVFKKDMNSKVADLLKFSQSFKLNKPIPDDLVPILAKDADKQRQIKEKSVEDAGSSQARSIGVSSPATAKPAPAATNATRPASKISPEFKAAMKNMVIPERKPKPSEAAAKAATPAAPAAVKPTQSQAPAKSKISASGKPLIPMHIPAIPAFRGRASPDKKEDTPPPNGSAKPALNINASSFKPNVGAKPFTPGGASGASPSSTPTHGNSPKPAQKEAVQPPNPFFGNRQLKKNTSHIKEDFNPFKHSRVADGTTISSLWPYHGKRYMMMFPPAPQQPQQPPPPNAAQHPHPMPVPIPMPPFAHPHQFPPHMVPPHMPQNGQQPNAQQPQPAGAQPAQPQGNAVNGTGQPSGPPPYSEEDAAQAAQRAAAAGYVYPMFGAPMPGAPPPQPGQPGQPGQPMQHMYPYYPGMAPPPAGMAYMPPYMAAPHMAGYPGMPAGMAPAMYAPPGMPGMPPHPGAAYPMHHPGGYPGPQPGQQPPQQGQGGQQQQNGGRPSMPPTPIPAHAHPTPAYWNQSPQMGHAVPYMMMPHPPGAVPQVPPHAQYDPNAVQQQQPQMGGHA